MIKKNAMDFKYLADNLIKSIKRYNHILIPIKGSPDPDALASTYMFKEICEAFGVKATIDSPVYPSMNKNVMIVKDLHLPIRFREFSKSIKSCDAYAILDHQSVFIEGITGVIPCVAHIDHHDEVKEDIPVDFKLVTQKAGSTCTIMFFLAQELDGKINLNEKKRVKTATALYYGIQTDTSNFQYAMSLDIKARDRLMSNVDMEVIEKVSSLPFSREGVVILNQAIQNQQIHQDWLISGLGYIEKSQRDIMAITADFLLKRDDISHVVIFAMVKSYNGITLDAVFRTKQSKFDLNGFIKRITGRGGGGRKYKGAYQVNLDYFRYCPDENLLWQMVFTTTIKALKETSKKWLVGGKGILWRFFRKHLLRLKSKLKPGNGDKGR